MSSECSLPGLEADATAATEIASVGLSAYLLHQAEVWAGNVEIIDGEPHYDGDPDQARYYIALAESAARLEADAAKWRAAQNKEAT